MWSFLVVCILLVSNDVINGNIITCDDLSVPTDEPTTDPSVEPTTDPTAEPTIQPTADPTTRPTTDPTSNPITTTPVGPAPTVSITPCGGLEDTIIFNDISCKDITTTQCQNQQEQIAYTMKSIKDTESGNGFARSRVAYVEFDGVNTYIKVSLKQTYNKRPFTTTDVDDYFNLIKNSPVCNDISNRTGVPNVLDAFQVMHTEFDHSQENLRDMAFILFSNCKVPQPDRAEVCAAYEESRNYIRLAHGYMINNGINFPLNSDPYLVCLTRYDIDQVWENPTVDNDVYYTQNGGILYDVQSAICGHPTPTPTTDPTPDPIQRRRRLSRDDQDLGSFDITGSFGTSAPCITMQVKLATENLVPLNLQPDVRSNINLIGKALANVTGALLHLPDIDTDEDDEWAWEIDPNCVGNPQIDDVILPSTTETMFSDADVSIENDELRVSMPLVTTESIMYVYDVTNLPLLISHSCATDIVITGTISHGTVQLESTSSITITANDVNRLKVLSLGSTVRLQPGTEYEIEFTSDTLSIDCDLTKIDVGEAETRRRLGDGYRTSSDIETDANPNSCVLGKALAKSDDMETGCETFCQSDLGSNANALKAGFFRMFGSQVALNNHGVRPGSIKVFNTDGAQTFIDKTFLRSVKKPCIAIDEEGNRVFALGGYNKGDGRAVDTISVYQFDNDALSSGHEVTELAGWVLDQARYGSMCFYWKQNDGRESIVVISGMASTAYEFEDATQFYDDIRIFDVPSSAAQLDEWGMINGKKSSSSPEVTKSLHYTGVTGSRPLIYDNHILYLFGGRTDEASTKNISLFNLNDIDSSNEAFMAASMELIRDKAAPLIDEVWINRGTEEEAILESCYMIFTGQSYEGGAPVDETGDGEDGLSVTNLQLFCKSQDTSHIDVNDVAQLRRLKEEDIVVSFSAFDREMFNEGRRRRLSTADNANADEILIRDTSFDLDGIWYNFTVKFELCYADNEELEAAVQDYEQSIDVDWEEYRAETEQNILNVSQEAYRGENNGFGAVRLFDLDILNVTYLATMDKCAVPTDSGLRRRLHTAETVNTPCIQLKLELETENLVPSNTDPDATSNIVLIAAALGELTSATITMPDIDNTGDESTTTQSPMPGGGEAIWTVEPECIGEPQIVDTYFPQGIPFAPQLEGNASMNSDGFSVFIPFSTPASIVYVFELTALPLKISHTCGASLNVIGVIYDDALDVLIAQTEAVEVLPHDGDVNKLLPFAASSVVLQPATDYVIIYKSIDTPFPSDCALSMISIGDDDGRRRMLDSSGYTTQSDFALDANPNSCLLGTALAKSPDMMTGAKTFCQTESRSNEAAIKAGFFRMFGSQVGLNNHGIRAGSMKVFDTSMLYTFIDNAWPAWYIKKPCIAIDKATRRVFGLGGYDKRSSAGGAAVNKIVVYQFDNDALTEGHVMTELNGWVLDKPRYGSMCFYWKQDASTENIVVISGMPNTAYEFADGGNENWFNDIRIFKIPTTASDLSNWNGIYGKKSYSKPELPQNEEKLVGFTGVIGSRPLLYDNHILYLFGGRTNEYSAPFVSSFNLNNIESSYAASQSVMRLSEGKAAPLMDQVTMNVGSEDAPDIKDCYMIFAGQTYESGAPVESEEGMTVKNLDLFCNENMADSDFSVEEAAVVARRRLKDENIVSLSAFDRHMLKQSSNRRRRRLFAEGLDEILIRDYRYGLDGLWYSFDVEFELCYEDNEALRNAEDYYENVVNNVSKWSDWRLQIGDKILNESLVAYQAWSNGFGAVNVTNLQIVSVNYKAKEVEKISHPERRKHRFWAHNIDDNQMSDNNFVWIDNQIDLDQSESDQL